MASSHLFIKKKDGYIYCLGRNDYGQLGLGDTTLRNTFTKVTTNVDDIKILYYNSNNSFIIKNDGTLWGTGRNNYGQLGLGDTTDRNTFTKIDIDNVKNVYCGDNHTIVLKKDGTLWGIGNNNYGQLGLGDTTDRNTFTKIDIDNIKEVYCITNNSFILKKDGTLWTTGHNSYGQLGLGDIIGRNTFTKIDIDNVKNVYCGNIFTMVLKKDGTLWSCGYNSNGQLGLGDTTLRTTFTKVTTNVDDIKNISCGGEFALIQKNDGTLWSCGRNSYGQLGLGDKDSRTTFTKVTTNVDDIKNIFALHTGSYALKEDFKLYSCGDDTGNKSASNSSPTFTQKTSNVEEIYPLLDSILLLIKSEGKYYTINQNSELVETSLDNFDSDAIDIDTINSNIDILPNAFNLVSNDESAEISLNGLKQKTFMIVPNESLSIDSAVYIKKINSNKTLTNAEAKIVVSADDGNTYYTYKDSKFSKIDVTIPNGNYSSFSNIDKENWENSKSKILSEGIDINDLNDIDFTSLGLVYGSMKLKYAIAISVQDTSSVVNFKDVTMTYSK